LFWHRPVKAACPACGSPVLLEKPLRGGKVKWACANPECAFTTDDLTEANSPSKEETH